MAVKFSIFLVCMNEMMNDLRISLEQGIHRNLGYTLDDSSKIADEVMHIFMKWNSVASECAEFQLELPGILHGEVSRTVRGYRKK